jgi:predicted acetyltransferase
MKLIKPSIDYKNEFKEYALDFKTVKEEYYLYYKDYLNDFNAYLVRLDEIEKGIKLPKNWSKGKTYWLIDNKNKVVGVIRYREKASIEYGNIGFEISPRFRKLGYGFLILKLLCEKLKKKGVTEILVTCNVDNRPSEKIIIKNKGEFINQVFDESDKVYVKRFIIIL